MYFQNIYQEKEVALHMNITQSWFVPGLIEIGQVVLENKIKIWHFWNKWTKLTWVFTSGDSKRLVVEINHHDIYHTTFKNENWFQYEWLREVLTTVLPG